jgi:hypothetical protein
MSSGALPEVETCLTSFGRPDTIPCSTPTHSSPNEFEFEFLPHVVDSVAGSNVPSDPMHIEVLLASQAWSCTAQARNGCGPTQEGDQPSPVGLSHDVLELSCEPARVTPGPAVSCHEAAEPSHAPARGVAASASPTPTDMEPVPKSPGRWESDPGGRSADETWIRLHRKRFIVGLPDG